MPTITMSDETYRALLPFTESGQLTAAQRQPDGRWRCDISDVVFDRLVSQQMIGESLDQTLIRLVDFRQSGGPH